MVEVFGTATPCSSTKGWTGHTLGASGILEAVIAGTVHRPWLHAGMPQCDAAGPGVPGARDRRQRAAPDPARHEQCIRLRRHQLQPHLRDRLLMEAFIRACRSGEPGLQGWAASQPILAGVQEYVASEASPPLPTLLSATERRRTGLAARLALIIAQQASEMAGIAPGAIPSVFATSNGDGAVVHCDPGGIGRGISRCRRPSSTIPCTTRRPATGRSQPDRSRPRPASHAMTAPRPRRC